MRKTAREYGRGSLTRLWMKMLLIVMQPRLPRSMRKAQRLDLALQGKPFSIWMQDRTGLAAFEEVFIRGEYSVSNIPPPRIIVDAGANIGVASVYFCMRYPGARVYAIEPDADVCTTLRKNLSVFSNASVHQCALSDIDGTIDFHIHPTSSIASSIQERVSGGRVVSVPSKKLDTFMKEQKMSAIDLLKFDIEGAEERLLRAIHNPRVVRCYVGEIHPDLMKASLEDIVSLFDGFTVQTNSIGTKRFLLTAICKE
ncbi:MAG: FkbM family methyltransferase [bacterium]|nr:FkbM family methyltransferase [bacterium]